MKGIDAETSKLHIVKLENILGGDWCDRELAIYAEFMKKYRPVGMWSHRHPATSPIVPLLFQYKNPKLWGQHQAVPLGYWYGDPVRCLQELAAHIFVFEDYWSKLPNDRGIENIRYKLTNASQFSGFWYELLVAAGYRSNNEYRDYHIEPLFFDPSTSQGSPDIVLKNDGDLVAIQCKARNPGAAHIMSFEEFQYLFGRFFRLVQDSHNSYKLSMNLRQRLGIEKLEQILELLRSAIGSNLQLPKHTINNSCDVSLKCLNIPITGLTGRHLNKIVERDDANLYAEGGGSGTAGRTVNKVALCSVSASQQKSAQEWVAEIVEDAAKNAQGQSPLIVAVHLYHYIRWEKYFNQAANRNRLETKLSQIFKTHPRIKYVNVSSNRQELFTLSDTQRMLRTQYVEFTNPFFKST